MFKLEISTHGYSSFINKVKPARSKREFEAEEFVQFHAAPKRQ